MLFNSITFFEFFLIVYTAYRIVPFQWQNRMLLAAGYVFYGAWDVRFLFLIAFSTTVDFCIGQLLSTGQLSSRQRRTAALFLIGAALLFLCPNWSAISSGGVSLASFFAPRALGLHVLGGTGLLIVLASGVMHRLARLPEQSRRRAFIVCSVLVNLAFLGFFKYCNFFVDSAEMLLRELGVDARALHLSVILPVGISFYTFQSLSYTIDVYRRRIQPTPNFWEFALFVAYFPPMVAGPIERARHLLPQLTHPRRIRLIQSVDGVVLILLGLFKKVAIADGVAPAVDAVFNSSGAVSQFDVAAASALFAVQIFCDFSGYSDIARGVSKLLGIELILNFDLPYFSRNPSEFWRRWHISLSSWLRDYLYIPLGGNQKGVLRTYVNLMLTMLLGGLWHGAAWNYVLWGGYQGALLCGHRWLTRRPPEPAQLAAAAGQRPPLLSAAPVGGMLGRLSTLLCILVFLAFCCYGWLLFRSHSLSQIRTFTGLLFGFGSSAPSVISKPTTSALIGMALLGVTQICDYASGALESFRRWPAPLQGLLYAAMLFVLLMGTSNAPVQFIYFQF